VLALRDLERVLVALEPELPPGAGHEPMEAVEDPGGGLSCPMCSGPMSHGGYLEQRFVRIDRCVPCMVLFTDAGELEAMAEQRARGAIQLALRSGEKEAVFEAVRWRAWEHYSM
jgi:Zn-finger nucleic acid-binding protein